MLIHKVTKSFMSRSDKPNENWLNDNNYFVVPDESELYYKILKCGDTDFELKVENGELIDIEPLVPEISQEEFNLDIDYRVSCLELGI